MPNVAESWEIVDGGKAVIFHLRKGMKWSDGHPLTTDDVAFYIDDIKFYEELDAVEPQEWDKMLHGGEPLSFGAAPTPWGPVAVRVESSADKVSVSWKGTWRETEPLIEVRLPGHAPVTAEAGQTLIEYTHEPASCTSS